MRLLIVVLLIAASVQCVPRSDAQQLTTNPRDLGGHYLNALSHRELAMTYLNDVTASNRLDRLVDAQAEFDLASAEFFQYASIPTNNSENVRIFFAASGLLMSYHAPEALKLIQEHPETWSEPRILRIKAEILLALDMGEQAALAYEQWIGQGKCIGAFYRNWPGEPRLGDGMVVLLPKGVTDACAGLATDLRARLETLQRLYGHPNNLPKKNYPPFPSEKY